MPSSLLTPRESFDGHAFHKGEKNFPVFCFELCVLKQYATGLTFSVMSKVKEEAAVLQSVGPGGTADPRPLHAWYTVHGVCIRLRATQDQPQCVVFIFQQPVPT